MRGPHLLSANGTVRTGRARRIAAFLTAVSLVTSVIAFASPNNRVALADPGDPPGTNSNPGSSIDPPLTLSYSTTLTTVAGDIQAFVFDGNNLLQDATSTVTFTGFSVPTGPVIAKTTYVVADGQCGDVPPVIGPEPCVDGSPTGGNGDTATFTGGVGTMTYGPDAFRGHDPCSWAIPGGDTCLWDTRTEVVSTQLLPTDTTATATVTAGGQGFDCLNHEAQVFAVGPAAAWAFGGYAASGVGFRNRTSASFTLAGIAPGATIVKAFLYWNILNDSNPTGAMKLNGTSTPGTLIGTDGSPCWPPTSSFAFRADVTSIVTATGNSVYTVSDYPSGANTGTSPWVSSSPAPEAEGASLIVFYSGQSTSTPGKVTGGGYIDPVTGQLVGEATLLINNGPSMGNKANFGFVMSFKAGDPSPSGTLLYSDKALSERIKATSIDQLVIGNGPCGANTHFDARITAEENGTPGQDFHVFGDDCAEPGSSPGSGPDMFGIQKLPVGYTAGGPLIGGNIQVHKS